MAPTTTPTMLHLRTTAITPPVAFHHFMPSERFISYANPGEILLYTDGHSTNQGLNSTSSSSSSSSPAVAAGCSFVYRPFAYPDGESLRNGGLCFRLEARGPDNTPHAPTANRAELRAVLAALQANSWHREGWESIVIACDSEYVILGMTRWMSGWERCGWVNAVTGLPVADGDLWRAVKEEMDKFIACGMKVCFWNIPREWNFEADQLARYAANLPPVAEFVQVRI